MEAQEDLAVEVQEDLSVPSMAGGASLAPVPKLVASGLNPEPAPSLPRRMAASIVKAA